MPISEHRINKFLEIFSYSFTLFDAYFDAYMGEKFYHSWNINPSEAISLQKKLSKYIITVGKPKKIDYIAGIDIAFDKIEKVGFCAIIVFKFPSMEIVEECFDYNEILFPYVPGLLSFREAPLILKVLRKIKQKCDCIIVDGHGIAHPRKFGLASHLGLLSGIPTIGCAKSKLCGFYSEPANYPNARSYIFDDSQSRIGIVLRTKVNTKPIFVSPGHLIGIDEAADIVYACVDGYRVCAPTRIAHIRVGEYKRRMLQR